MDLSDPIENWSDCIEHGVLSGVREKTPFIAEQEVEQQEPQNPVVDTNCIVDSQSRSGVPKLLRRGESHTWKDVGEDSSGASASSHRQIGKEAPKGG